MIHGSDTIVICSSKPYIYFVCDGRRVIPLPFPFYPSSHSGPINGASGIGD